MVSLPHIPTSLNWWLIGSLTASFSWALLGFLLPLLVILPVIFLVLITGLHADNALVLISSLDPPPELHAACSAFPFGCLLIYIWHDIGSRPKWTCDLSLNRLPVFSVRQRVSAVDSSRCTMTENQVLGFPLWEVLTNRERIESLIGIKRK